MFDVRRDGDLGGTGRVRTDFQGKDLGWSQACRVVRQEIACKQTNRRVVGDRRSARSPKYRAGRSVGRPIASRSLGQLREELFGRFPAIPRFPLLIKLLDAQEKLSLQVHPPQEIAESLGGEAKTEFWYVLAAEPYAEIFVGLRKSMTRDQFENALNSGTVADCIYPIRMKSGAAMLLPSGRFHAVGAGILLVEVQQNSDTTYRIFDWNRVDEHGERRQLQVDQALRCIDFNDVAPEPITPSGELLVRHELFEVQNWRLNLARDVAPLGQFAIVLCLTGALQCAGADFTPGDFFLVPASLQDRSIRPRGEGTSLLRITIPM